MFAVSLIKSLDRAIELGRFPIELTGSTAPAFLAWVLAQKQERQQPTVVVCPNSKTAQTFVTDLAALAPSKKTVLLEALTNPLTRVFILAHGACTLA